MSIYHKKIVHKDARGTLTDIFEKTTVNSCVLVTQNKGSIRGNHIHKKTIQYTYILEGRLKFFSKPPKGKVTARIVQKGDFVVSPKGYAHTFLALKDSVLIAFANGPRGGKSYESDTYRLSIPLQKLIKK